MEKDTIDKVDRTYNNLTNLFFQLNDEFFIELYENDYDRLRSLCYYLTLEHQLNTEKIKKGEVNVDA